MKTLKKITLLTLTLLITSIVFGQTKERKRPSKEKVKAMKIGYITGKLNLTPEEAQKFWPIYNEFDAKMEEIRKQHRKSLNWEADGVLDDTEVEKIVDSQLILEQKELDIKKEYHVKFKKILTIFKVAKLYKADKDFKRDLLKRIKNHYREVDEYGNFVKDKKKHQVEFDENGDFVKDKKKHQVEFDENGNFKKEPHSGERN